MLDITQQNGNNSTILNHQPMLIFKQDDPMRKLNLLKQIKITLESLMFGSQSGFSNNWHKFNANNIIFCKHILAILEDGLNIKHASSNQPINKYTPSLSILSSSSSLDSSSPEQINPVNGGQQSSASSGSSSRKTTQTSLGSTNNKLNQCENGQFSLLWSFISLVLNEPTANNNNGVEHQAKKNFKQICVQLIQQQKLANDANSSLDIEDEINLLINSSPNIVFDWICSSVRQHCLLNQLVCLFSDEFLARKFYQLNSFVLDPDYLKDFFIFIQAYEQNDTKILNKVKRNFFLSPTNAPLSSSPSNAITQLDSFDSTSVILRNKLINRRHQKQNSADLTTIMRSAQHSNISNPARNSLLQLASIDLISQNKLSVTSSINDLNDDIMSNVSNASNNSLNDSLIELKVKELNANVAKTVLTQTHRRMHSFPNIQINLLKKNSMLNSNNDNKQDEQVNVQEDNTSNNVNEMKKIVPQIVLNDETKPVELNDTSIETKPTVFSDDLFEKTTVFDFIHALQLQSECSTLDKENSHFVMADLAMASIELIKTNNLVNVENSQRTTTTTTTTTSITATNFTSRNLIKSNSIRITSNDRSVSSASMSNDSFDTNRSGSFTSAHHASPGQQALFIIAENESAPNGSVDTVNHIDKYDKDETDTERVLKLNEESKVKREKWLQTRNTVNLLNTSVESASYHDTNLSESFNNSYDQADLESVVKQQKVLFDIIEKNGSNRSGNKALTEDGFEIVNKAQNKSGLRRLNSQDTLRSRRYSWEEINDEETAENLANLLIKNSLDNHFDLIKGKCHDVSASSNNNSNLEILKLLDSLSKKKQTIYSFIVPKLRDFEFFIQYLEYDEFMQSHHELKNSGKLKKLNQMVPLKNLSTNNDITNNRLSASSMFLSHIQPSASTTNNTSSTSKASNLKSHLFGSINGKQSVTTESTSKSTAGSKIKSAALAAALTISLLQMQSPEEDKLNDKSHDSVNDNEKSAPENKLLLQSMNTNNSEQTNKLMRELSLNIQSSNSFDFSASFTSQSLQSNAYKNLNSRIIGDEIWAPVREQLILNYAKKQKRFDQMKLQHFRCADCGIQVRQDKIKTFSYCEYFSKYFCRCCHINNKSYIPAYVVNSLDFRTNYEVSKKAKNFLEKIFNEPLITLESLNPSLFEGNTIFSKVKKARFKLHNSRSYVNSCRLALDLKEKIYAEFDDFLINDQHVYSMEVLFKIKKTNYFEQLKNLVNSIIEHIKNCEICSQQGYICGICPKNDLLYPFDLENAEKCPNCLACYHKACFKSPEHCPRCERKRQRKVSSNNTSMTSTQLNDIIQNS